MKFGEKIKSLRQQHGMSQGELAAALGVSVRTVQNYESAGMHPRRREIYYRLGEIFDVDVNFLLTEGEDAILGAYQRGGLTAARDVEELISGVCGLFAGGTLPPEDLDAAMKAISDAYFSVKEENKKYTPKKYIK